MCFLVAQHGSTMKFLESGGIPGFGRGTLEIIDGKAHEQILVIEEVCLVIAVPQLNS